MTASTARGGVIWITGVPAAGKTTLASALYSNLRRRGKAVLWLDSDDMRRVMTPNPTYSRQERDVFYRTLGHLAKRGAEGGILAIVSATASKRTYRDTVRKRVEPFVEIWLTCPLEVLRQRDPKGLYAKQEAEEIANLPGRDAEYEEPPNPELIFSSDEISPEKMCALTVDYLIVRQMI